MPVAGWFLLLLASFVPVCSWGRSASIDALGDATCDALFLWMLWPLLWLWRGRYLAACVLLLVFGLLTSCYYGWFGRQCVVDTFAIVEEATWDEMVWFLQCRPWHVWLTVAYPSALVLAILFCYFKSRNVDWRCHRRGAGSLLGIYAVVLLCAFGPAEVVLGQFSGRGLSGTESA